MVEEAVSQTMELVGVDVVNVIWYMKLLVQEAHEYKLDFLHHGGETPKQKNVRRQVELVHAIEHCPSQGDEVIGDSVRMLEKYMLCYMSFVAQYLPVYCAGNKHDDWRPKHIRWICK